MPAKSTTGRSATPAPASTKPAPAAEPAPQAKTVKVAKAAGPNVATVTRKAGSDPRPLVPASEREGLIAEAAYFRAEARGFAPGDDQADWFAAAQDVDSRYRFTP